MASPHPAFSRIHFYTLIYLEAHMPGRTNLYSFQIFQAEMRKFVWFVLPQYIFPIPKLSSFMNTPREIPRYVTQSLSKVRNFIGVYIPCVAKISTVKYEDVKYTLWLIRTITGNIQPSQPYHS